MGAITPITMPKFGLAMTEGQVADWHVDVGTQVERGEDLADIETTKITNAYESPIAGIVRRHVVEVGEIVPVGALIAVVADADVSDADIDAFVADFQASFVPEETGEEEAGGPEPEKVEAGGHTVQYLIMGEGDDTPLLLIHGFGGDLNTWMFNHSTLAEGRRVIAVDLPGHGGSSKALDDGSVAALVGVVEAFLDAVGHDRVHVAGHSMGGAVAASLSARSPHRVASLSLLAPAGMGDEINTDFIQGFIQASRRKKLQPVLEMLVADKSLIGADMMEEVLKFKRLDGVIDALTRIAEANFVGGRQASRIDTHLHSVTVPVQIIWGEKDEILPVDHAENAADHVTTHRLPDTGHMPHMERSADVNRLINAFIGG